MTASGTAKDPSVPVAPDVHPSGPLPVHGGPLGRSLRRPLGETGLRVFPLILGGAEFGWHIDIAAAHAILDRYTDRGGNAVHTSDSYAAGRSEHVIGQWMRSRRNRDDVVVAVRVGRGPDNPGLGPTNLVRAVEASLTRLGTDRIDVLYLDGTADRRTLLEDTLATTEWLVEAGKVRHVGAAGHTAAQLVEARILSAAGYPRLTVLDVPYNVLRRDGLDGDLRLVAGAQGIAVTPSQALEHGYLSGAHRERDSVGADVRGRQLAASMNRRGARTLRALDRIATEVGVPPAAVAIAWLLAQRIVAAPIVNAYAASHVDELMQAAGVHLNRSHLAEIARATD